MALHEYSEGWFLSDDNTFAMSKMYTVLLRMSAPALIQEIRLFGLEV